MSAAGIVHRRDDRPDHIALGAMDDTRAEMIVAFFTAMRLALPGDLHDTPISPDQADAPDAALRGFRETLP